MRNQSEDLKQQAVEMGKEKAKNAVKEALKKVGKQIMSAIAPYIGYIVLAIIIIVIIVGCVDWDDVGITASADGVVGDGFGGISLTTTMFDKNTFKEALEAYYNETNNQNFYNNFLSKVDELYNESVKNNVNPELVVVTAECEGNYTEQGGSYNYWGIGVPNGATSGNSYNSFSEGIEGYAKTLKEYNYGGAQEAKILKRYEERSSAGCDSTGFGLPGTLSGMQSAYSFLGNHEEGSSGTGGYYYMDPDRAGVTKIYSTHEEFVEKCLDVDGEHAEGTETTPYEQGQYTAWQVESKISTWNKIFGDYGSLTQSISGEAGTEQASNNPGIRSYYTNSKGRTFTLYIQNDSNSSWYWDEGCYVSSQATIISGYTNKTITPNQLSGWKADGLPSDFTTFGGCTMTSSTESVRSQDIINYLKDDKVIFFHVSGKALKTDNGSTTYENHFLCILDYKKDENGVDKVFIHDPWDGNNSYGWANISDVVKAIDAYRAIGA